MPLDNLWKGFTMHIEAFSLVLHLSPIAIGVYAVHSLNKFQKRAAGLVEETLQEQSEAIQKQSDEIAHLNRKHKMLVTLHEKIQADLKISDSNNEEYARKRKSFENKVSELLAGVASKTVKTKQECFAHVQQLARSHQMKQNTVDDRLTDLEQVSKYSLDALHAKKAQEFEYNLPKDQVNGSEE